MKKLTFILVILAVFCMNDVVSQWGTNGTHIYNTNTGNVGIGNSSPSTLLYVAKNMTEPTITVQNLGGTGGATYTMADNMSGANWKFKATSTGGFKIRDHANSLDVFVIEPNSAANSLYISGAGTVGIGTAAPGTDKKLHVVQGNGTGIYSSVSGTGSYAIYGNTTATSGTCYAVYGYQNSTGGASGYFVANNDDGACAGVLGRAHGDIIPASCGVVGYHYGDGVGVGAWSFAGDLIRGYDGDYPGGTIRFYVNQSGAVYADGGYNTFKKTMSAKGAEEYRTLNAIQATESRIEDIGSSELLNGEAIVGIDPVFAQTVDLQAGYQVFLTPVCEEIVCLVVTGKSPQEFTVKGSTLTGRPVSCSFDYKIVAKDSQSPNTRMEVVDIPAPVNLPRNSD